MHNIHFIQTNIRLFYNIRIYQGLVYKSIKLERVIILPPPLVSFIVVASIVTVYPKVKTVIRKTKGHKQFTLF